jgi:hypothetical protein
MVLRPTDELIKAFNIRQGSPGVLPRTDGSIMVNKEIPYEYIRQLNPDPSWTMWFYLGDYNGNFTPSIKALFPENLLKEIADLKNKLEIERYRRAVAEEKMKLIETNLPKYFHKNITPMITDIVDAAGKLLPTKPVKND